MEFIKKLIIMTGGGGAKGAVTVEKNAYGTFASVSAYNLKRTPNERYFVFISDKVCLYRFADSGKFDLKGARLSGAHCCVASVKGKETDIELYGTDDVKKMWQSNLCDLIRSKLNGKTENIERADQETEESRKIEGYFLDIFPSIGGPYTDNVVAGVNYYSNIYSGRAQASAQENGYAVQPLEHKDKAAEKAETAILPLFTGAASFDGLKVIKAESVSNKNEPLRDDGLLEQDPLKTADTATVKSDFAETQEEKHVPLYARYIYSYRDSILNRNGAPPQTFKTAAAGEPREEFKERTSSREPREEPNERTPSRDLREEPNERTSSRDLRKEPNERTSSREPREELNESAAAADPLRQTLKTVSLKTAGLRTGAEAKIRLNKESEDKIPAAPKADDELGQMKLKEARAEKLNFYERIKEQLHRLFEENEREERLEKLLPKSTWVKIRLEGTEKYYCLGLLGRPDYICYGVPAPYSEQPPEELEGYCQWMPLNPASPKGEGYWLLYQDAATGDSVPGLETGNI